MLPLLYPSASQSIKLSPVVEPSKVVVGGRSGDDSVHY